MSQRLAVIVMQPNRVLDWGSRAGASAEVLRSAYPQARHRAVEPASGEPHARRHDASWLRRMFASSPVSVTTTSEVVRGEAQLLWANMMLHWVEDPQAEMQRWSDALEPHGFLMFSTLGPGTLASLRGLYATQGWAPAHAAFVDMHDLGDMLMNAGFADPVMDQEVVTLTWADGDALLEELRSLGANADPTRFQGLRTPRWRRALIDAIERLGNGRPGLEFEIIYGHAFRAPPNTRVREETRVDLADMRSILRRQRDL